MNKNDLNLLSEREIASILEENMRLKNLVQKQENILTKKDVEIHQKDSEILQKDSEIFILSESLEGI